jgi:hypothetical protein
VWGWLCGVVGWVVWDGCGTGCVGLVVWGWLWGGLCGWVVWAGCVGWVVWAGCVGLVVWGWLWGWLCGVGCMRPHRVLSSDGPFVYAQEFYSWTIVEDRDQTVRRELLGLEVKLNLRT